MHTVVLFLMWHYIGFLAGLVFLELQSQEQEAQKFVAVMVRKSKMRFASEIPVTNEFVEPPKKRARPRISSCDLMAYYDRLKALQEKELHDKERDIKMQLKSAMAKRTAKDQNIFTSGKDVRLNTYCAPKRPFRLSRPAYKMLMPVIQNVIANHPQTFTSTKVGGFKSRCARETTFTAPAPVKNVHWSNPLTTQVW